MLPAGDPLQRELLVAEQARQQLERLEGEPGVTGPPHVDIVLKELEDTGALDEEEVEKE
jgi:hypothetical protein